LTRNHRVDYISAKVDILRANKKKVSHMASQIESSMNKTVELMMKMNELMVEVWKEELGERSWDDNTKEYIRTLQPSELSTIREMDEAMASYKQRIITSTEGFLKVLKETEEKPLTFCTPEEEAVVEKMKKTKERYKEARTEYSDAMIDYETERTSGNEPRQKTLQKVEEKQAIYEEMSEKFAEDAIKFETLYRDELTQRIIAHFTAQTLLIRGLNQATKEFNPYSKSLTLDLVALQSQFDYIKKNGNLSDEELGKRANSSSLPPPVSGVTVGGNLVRNESSSSSSKKKSKKKSKDGKDSKDKEHRDSGGDDQVAKSSLDKDKSVSSKANTGIASSSSASASTSAASTSAISSGPPKKKNPFEEDDGLQPVDAFSTPTTTTTTTIANNTSNNNPLFERAATNGSAKDPLGQPVSPAKPAVDDDFFAPRSTSRPNAQQIQPPTSSLYGFDDPFATSDLGSSSAPPATRQKSADDPFKAFGF